MLSALLAVVILAFQLYFGLIPVSQTRHAWESILLPYAILVVYLCLVSAMRAPVEIDKERCLAIGELKEKVGTLETENLQLRGPQPSRLLQTQISLVKHYLTNCPKEVRQIVNFLLLHGEMKWSELRQHFAPGVPDASITGWLGEAKNQHLLEQRFEELEQQFAWSVRSEFRPALQYFFNQQA